MRRHWEEELLLPEVNKNVFAQFGKDNAFV